MIKTILIQITSFLKDIPDSFEMVDHFQGRNEIWFNFGGKTFILTIRELE